jgi:hypothetical protein
MKQTSNADAGAVTNSLFPSADRPFFYTDPSGDGSCFFSTEVARDAAMAEAIAAWCDEGWSEEVEQIFAGVVSHTVEQCDVQKKPQPCAAHPDHDYGDNDCEACTAWDEFPNHEFDEICNYKPVALRAPTAEQAEGAASDEVIDLAVALEQKRALHIVADVRKHGFSKSANAIPTQAEAVFDLACEEIEHRLRTETWELAGVTGPLPAASTGDQA